VSGGVGAFQDNAQIVVHTQNGDLFSKNYEVFGAGTVTDLAFDPFDPDRLIAGMWPAAFGTAALTRSLDGGDSWVNVPGTAGWSTRAVAWNPHQAGHVMQLSDNNQWSQSFNGGATFMDLQPAWPGSASSMLLVFDPHVPGMLYRGEAGTGLWRSLDTGATWTSLGVGLQSQSDLLTHPDLPGLIWVSDNNGDILVSADHGLTFDVALDVPLGADGAALALDTSTGDLLVGTDGSSMWEVLGGCPLREVGDGTVGSGGFVPSFHTTGALPQLGNPAFGLAVEDVLGGALMWLAIGVGETSLPVFGGSFVVDNVLQWRLVAAGGPAGVPGAGSFNASFPVPNDPAFIGLTAVAQFAVLDAGAPHPSGVALTNGMAITGVQ